MATCLDDSSLDDHHVEALREFLSELGADEVACYIRRRAQDGLELVMATTLGIVESQFVEPKAAITWSAEVSLTRWSDIERPKLTSHTQPGSMSRPDRTYTLEVQQMGLSVSGRNKGFIEFARAVIDRAGPDK